MGATKDTRKRITRAEIEEQARNLRKFIRRQKLQALIQIEEGYEKLLEIRAKRRRLERGETKV